MAEITVLRPTSYSDTLMAVQSETSSVFGSAQPELWLPGMGISVGDYSSNIAVQGFVSFDISVVPANAVVTDAEVDLSGYRSTGGTPFAAFGCLRVYAQNYGVLEKTDFFTGNPSDALLQYCSEVAIVPEHSERFRDSLQEAVGRDRFQIRVQFNEANTDNNGDQDYIHWDYDELTIHIAYESYQ